MTTLSPTDYNLFLTAAISRYIRWGIPRREAINRAHELMRYAFPRQEPDILAVEHQKDHDEDQEGLYR